jgi:hypothetical protein
MFWFKNSDYTDGRNGQSRQNQVLAFRKGQNPESGARGGQNYEGPRITDAIGAEFEEGLTQNAESRIMFASPSLLILSYA